MAVVGIIIVGLVSITGLFLITIQTNQPVSISQQVDIEFPDARAGAVGEPEVMVPIEEEQEVPPLEDEPVGIPPINPGDVIIEPPLLQGEVLAVLETEFGNIVLRLYPQTAPGHVENFIKLAKEGFYDGTAFHRVIPGFMIQGGDPNTKDEDRSNDGQGGPGFNIKAEFSNTPHRRGILSMARSPSGPDTAGSQFFIVVSDSLFLDGQYSVFGEVIEGMDVVDRIVNAPTDGNDNPIDRIVIKTIRISSE